MIVLGVDPSPTISLPLSSGLVALIDRADAHLADFKWTARVNGRYGAYALRGVGVRPGRRLVYLHREVMRAAPGQHVDHINGNGLDCRRCNLRVVTRSENMRNRGAQVNGCGFKGVGWHKARRQWRSRIGVNGKVHNLGWFADATAAARAYDVAALRLHGEFARLNFPNEVTP